MSSGAEYSDSDEDCDLVQDPINITLLPPKPATNSKKRVLNEIEEDSSSQVSTDHNHEPPSKKQRSELDINKAQSMVCGDGSHGLQHWTIYPGLNYYGEPVHKQSCPAFGQKVAIPRGAGNCNVIKDKNMRQCPSCNERFELQGIFLFQCTATVQYQIGDNPVMHHQHEAVGNNYIDFGEQQKIIMSLNKDINQKDIDDHRLSNYQMLQFDVKPLTEPQSPQTQPPQIQQQRSIVPQYHNVYQAQPQQHQQYTLSGSTSNNEWTNNLNHNQSGSTNSLGIEQEIRQRIKEQMARHVVNAYSGTVTLEKVLSMDFERVQGLHDEIMKLYQRSLESVRSILREI